jgi:hypothetical protein
MLSLLITLLVIGAVLYLIQLAPIDGTIKQIIMVVAILFVIIWVLKTLAPQLGMG